MNILLQYSEYSIKLEVNNTPGYLSTDLSTRVYSSRGRVRMTRVTVQESYHIQRLIIYKVVYYLVEIAPSLSMVDGLRPLP
jgi:hypothetical protein